MVRLALFLAVLCAPFALAEPVIVPVVETLWQPVEVDLIAGDESRLYVQRELHGADHARRRAGGLRPGRHGHGAVRQGLPVHGAAAASLPEIGSAPAALR